MFANGGHGGGAGAHLTLRDTGPAGGASSRRAGHS